MVIERFEIFPLRLPLAQPFETAAGAIDERRLAVIRLTAADGTVGLGEVTPYPSRFDALDDMIGALEVQARPRLEGLDLERTASAVDELGARLSAPALAAVDTALLDLQARAIGVPLAELFDRPARRSVPVNATIAQSGVEDVARAARAAVDAGFKSLKLKVGLPDDAWRVAALRDEVGYGIALRIDANGAWFTREAIGQIQQLTEHGIELVEQPVKADDLAGMHMVRDAVLVPVVADEGVRDTADLRKHLQYHACDGVAVKVSQVGGLYRANVLVEEAEKAGLFAFVTSTLDGPIGLAAGLHFAASRREIEIACGLATGDVFAETYATGLPRVANGELTPTSAPGLGIDLIEDALSELALN